MKTYKQVMVGLAAVAAMVGSAQAASVTFNWITSGVSLPINTTQGDVQIKPGTGSVTFDADGSKKSFTIQPYSFKVQNNPGADDTKTYTETITAWLSGDALPYKTESYGAKFTVTKDSTDKTVEIVFLKGSGISFFDGAYSLTLTPTKVTASDIAWGSTITGDLNATVTAVPEPYQYGLVSMFGLFGLAAFDRIRQRKLVG